MTTLRKITRIPLWVLTASLAGSCASKSLEEDAEDSLPVPTSEVVAAETEVTELVLLEDDPSETPESEANLPALDVSGGDRSQISGWKVKDATKELTTDRDLTPSMEDPSIQGLRRQSTDHSVIEAPALVQQER